MSRQPMTKKGVDRLREELAQLKKVERPKIIAAIAEARAHGDLKEMPSTTPRVSSRALSRGASSTWNTASRMRRSSMSKNSMRATALFSAPR